MIDFIKFSIKDKFVFEHNLKKIEDLSLLSKYDMNTGEILEYPKKGKDNNLDIRVTNNYAYISGSVHKYYNCYVENECHNYDDFNYYKWQIIKECICSKYRITPEKTKITNLEFAINIITREDPMKIIDNYLLMYNFKAPSKYLKFIGKGDYKEFQMTDYSVKVYNKGKHFKLGYNLLRIEIKITKSRYLEKLGIFTLEDLNKEAFYSLFDTFLDNYNKLLIIDEYRSKNILKEDLDKLNEYTNPSYWIDIKNTVSRSTINNRKDEFNELIKKYNLNTLKKTIYHSLKYKFTEIMNYNTNKKVA